MLVMGIIGVALSLSLNIGFRSVIPGPSAIFAPGAIVQGLLLVIAGSMPLCCMKPGNAACIFLSSAILTGIATVISLAGAVFIFWLIAQIACSYGGLEAAAAAVVAVIVVLLLGFIVCQMIATAAFVKAKRSSYSVSPTVRCADPSVPSRPT